MGKRLTPIPELNRFAAGLRLSIDHAVWGIHSGLAGCNTLLRNRLYFIQGYCNDHGHPATDHTPVPAAAGEKKPELGSISWTGGRVERRIHFLPESIYFIPKGIPLSWRFSPGCRLAAVHFSLEIIPGLDLFEQSTDCMQIDGKDAADFVNRMMAEVVCVPSTKTYTAISGIVLQAAGLFTDSTVDDIRAMIAKKEKHARLFSVIETRPPGALSVSKLAAQCGCHRDTLSRTFRRDFGVPLKEYLSRLTTERASALLASTDKPGYQIADALGFKDEFYFSRFFKRRTGTTPREYRETHSILDFG